MNTSKTTLLTAACAAAALSAPTDAAIIEYSNEDFESVGTGQFGATNTTDWDNSTDASKGPDKVTIEENLSGEIGKHVWVGGNKNKHISTEAGLLTLATDAVTSLEISFAMLFSTDNAGPAVKLVYSALGDFTDGVDIVTYSPLDAAPAPDDDVWYDLTVTILDSEVTFTDTAKLRWVKLAGSTSASNAAVFDDIKIEGVPVPEPGSLALMGLGGLLVARRRRG